LVWKDGSDLQAPAEGLNVVAESAQIDVVLMLDLGDVGLADAERLGDLLLRQVAARAQLLDSEHVPHGGLVRLDPGRRFRRAYGLRSEFSKLPPVHGRRPSRFKLSRCSSYKRSATGIIRSYHTVHAL